MRLLCLAEAHFILHGWLLSGDCRSGRGAMEFLKEALAQLPDARRVGVVRADAVFFDGKLLEFLEERQLASIVVGRLTRCLKREAGRVEDWRAIDEDFAVGEFGLQLFNWERARRFVVIREPPKEKQDFARKKLLEVPGYTFRLFVTNLAAPPEEIRRNYNQRADRPGYDALPVRDLEFVPLWGIAVFFVYALRRVNCKRCWVKVEAVPWATGEHTLTTTCMQFLALWALSLVAVDGALGSGA